MQLGDLDTTVFSIGKGAVFYADAWDFNSNIYTSLQPLGFTEGQVSVEMNETFNELTLPEYTGDAPHKRFVQGEAPVATIPLYLADPELRAVISPTGSASGGFRRQLPVKEYTLVVLPEELFLDPVTNFQEDLVLAATGTGWTLGGSPLSTEKERLLNQSVWLWRGSFTKTPMRYQHEEGGKVVDEATFSVMYQVAAPNGHRLYTIGDPYDADIDVTTGVMGS